MAVTSLRAENWKTGAAMGALVRNRGVPAVLGATVLWLADGSIGHGSFGGTLKVAVLVGSFLALTGLGQLFVVATGAGNIDLSIPYVMTLSAYLSGYVIDGHNAELVPALFAIVGLGAAVGIANACCVLFLRIPAIVATLAVGFVIESTYLDLSNHVSGGPGSAVTGLVSGSWAGVPYVAVIVAGCLFVAHLVLDRSWFGRNLLALGQSRRAAQLAGTSVTRMTVSVYVISAVTAAIAGLLLAGYIGGESLGMSTSYQLGSVVVVVLGGCLVSGGVVSCLGVAAAGIFSSLLVTFTTLIHVSAGVQDIAQGLIIVALLASVGKERFRAL